MRLWEDGFDHYGTDTSKMLDGSYASASGTLSTSLFSTGTASFKPIVRDSSSSPSGLRWVLPSTTTKMGVVARVYCPSLPTANQAAMVFDFLTTTITRSHLYASIDSQGAIRFYRGANYAFNSTDNGTLVAQTDPILTSAAWNHIEIQVNIDDTQGWVRVAVNGVHRFSATGLDTRYNTDAIGSVCNHVGFYTSIGATADYYLDDLIYYDFTGNSAVDTDFCPTVDGSGVATSYIGELQVWPLYTNGDTSNAAWLKSSGTVGYSLINEVPPVDTSYIYSTATGDLSEFALDDLPAQITYVRGLGIHARMSKSDAGAAMLKLGMKSVVATSDAAERPVTTAPTYWVDQINVDPNSSSRWTRASLNAAWLRFTRSA